MFGLVPSIHAFLRARAATERAVRRIHHGGTENTEKEGGRFAAYFVASFDDVRVIPVDSVSSVSSVSSVPPW
jgi:hypothetical protein